MLLSPALLWNAAAGTLAFLAFALLLWSLFWDRAKGRLRCPRCWYDMRACDGAPPPHTCPECGRVARTTRALRRTRRRRKAAAAAACLLALVAYTWPSRQRIQDRGWIGAIPTTALALFVPVGESAWEWHASEGFGGRANKEISGPLNPFLKELTTRLDEHDAWLLHWRLLVSRTIAANPLLKEELCKSRPVWPVGEAVYVRGSVPSFTDMSFANLEITAKARGDSIVASSSSQYARSSYDGTIGIARDSHLYVVAEIKVATRQLLDEDEHGSYPIGPDPSSYRTIWRGAVRRVQVGGNVHDLMKPVGAPSDGSDIAEDLYPALLRKLDGSVILGLGHFNFHVGGENDCAIGLRLEVQRNGNPVASGTYFIHNWPPKGGAFINPGSTWNPCPLEWTAPYPKTLDDMRQDTWTLRVTGDPSVALRDFGRDRYWTGSFEMRIRHIEDTDDDDF